MQTMIKLIENYSDKGIAVIGNTFPIKEELKALNGSFNRALKYEGLTVTGYVFSKKRIEAIRLLVAKHSKPENLAPVTVPPVTITPIVEREIKPKVEPVKQVKQVVKTQQTGFKMLVKCTGFVELEREFTSEQVMNKFLNDLRERRQKDVDTKIGKPHFERGKSRIGYCRYLDERREAESKLKETMIKYGIEPLKIQFTNLINT